MRSLLLLLMCGAALAQPALPRIIAGKTLRVGMHAGVSPFVATDCDELKKIVGERMPAPQVTKDGKHVCGIDVELAAEAAAALHVTLEIVLVDRFDDLLPGLREGRYDVAIDAITRTLDRAVTIAFTEPYFASGLEVRAREKFTTLESLRGATIAFEGGTTAETFARASFPQAKLQAVNGDAQLFAAMNSADAVVIDFVTARDAEVRHIVAPLPAVEGRRVTTEQFAFAVRQGDPDWLGWLNLFLKREKTSGAFHKLAARFNPWFKMER